jgi:D-xylonolactonase
LDCRGAAALSITFVDGGPSVRQTRGKLISEEFMQHAAITPAAKVDCQLGENPLWDADKNCLYWTDISAGKIFQLDASTERVCVVYEGEPVGGFTLQKNGDLLLFRVNDIALLEQSGRISVLRQFHDDGMRRFNDVIADPRGRVFAGTLGEDPKAGLYRVDLDGSITKLFSGTGCSNGMGFSPCQKKLYWTCSTTRRIFQFDFDIESGAIDGRKLFYKAAHDEGIPDGLTVDAEGCVWSARWGGASVIRHAPDGEILDQIQFPATNITSFCFGGRNLDELFVTSAKKEGENYPAHVFKTQIRDAHGVLDFRSRISIPIK